MPWPTLPSPPPTGPAPPALTGLQRCSARELVDLGRALSATNTASPPPPALAAAYAAALWPKLVQVPAATALRVFMMLVGWGAALPAGMLNTFLTQVRGAWGARHVQRW